MFLIKFIAFVWTFGMIIAGNLRLLWIERRINRPKRLEALRETVKGRVANREQRLQKLGW